MTHEARDLELLGDEQCLNDSAGARNVRSWVAVGVRVRSSVSASSLQEGPALACDLSLSISLSLSLSVPQSSSQTPRVSDGCSHQKVLEVDSAQ